MAAKSAVAVTIRGKEFRIRTDADAEELQRVAALLDQALAVVERKTGTVDSLDVALLTGLNVPALLGEHYGPRPDGRIRAILDSAGIFRRLVAAERRPFFCNAYPQRYFDVIHSGRRRLSAVGQGKTRHDREHSHCHTPPHLMRP